MAKVLRAFDYSFDGITALKAKVDDDIDFLDMTDGLVAEGYVSAVEKPVVEAAAVADETLGEEVATEEPVVTAESEPAEEVPPAPTVEPKRNRK